MKPFTYILLVTLLLISCGPSSKESQIIGRWSYTASHATNIMADPEDGMPQTYMTYLIESIDEFKEDLTERESGSFEIYFDITLPESGITNTVILEYMLDYQGTWNVQGDILNMTGESCTYKYIKGYILRPSPYFDEKHYVDLMKKYVETTVIQPLIEVQLSSNHPHIQSVSADELILQYDGDVNQQTLTRLKGPLLGH